MSIADSTAENLGMCEERLLNTHTLWFPEATRFENSLGTLIL